ncbi:GNAT family N-acetyltransferase, partial [Pseudomonas syringae]|uniref:GNAT family N-acetyltransferase n=1 Tax=Pseudomonas syringae TaxID=317 RepID=UPI001F301030
MQYSGEGFSLRVLTFDDSELIHRYENANRRHLQPWEPLRGEDYFILENARSRVQQQWESMQACSAFFFLITEPERGELLGRCSYTNIVRGAFQACHLGFSLAETAQGRGLMKRALEVTNRYCFEQMGLPLIIDNHIPAH